jgi:heat shock protein HslJ
MRMIRLNRVAKVLGLAMVLPLLALPLLAGCSAGGRGMSTTERPDDWREGTASKVVTLEDTQWVLVSYGETGSLASVVGDVEITAEFKREDKQVAGAAGCNQYFGGYELSGLTLAIPGPLGSTAMACAEDVMDQESAYLQALQAAESYEIAGDELRIDCGEQLLVFKIGGSD